MFSKGFQKKGRIPTIAGVAFPVKESQTDANISRRHFSRPFVLFLLLAHTRLELPARQQRTVVDSFLNILFGPLKRFWVVFWWFFISLICTPYLSTFSGVLAYQRGIGISSSSCTNWYVSFCEMATYLYFCTVSGSGVPAAARGVGIITLLPTDILLWKPLMVTLRWHFWTNKFVLVFIVQCTYQQQRAVMVDPPSSSFEHLFWWFLFHFSVPPTFLYFFWCGGSSARWWWWFLMVPFLNIFLGH